jgi:hypothetical protein
MAGIDTRIETQTIANEADVLCESLRVDRCLGLAGTCGE